MDPVWEARAHIAQRKHLYEMSFRGVSRPGRGAGKNFQIEKLNFADPYWSQIRMGNLEVWVLHNPPWELGEMPPLGRIPRPRGEGAS